MYTYSKQGKTGTLMLNYLILMRMTSTSVIKYKHSNFRGVINIKKNCNNY